MVNSFSTHLLNLPYTGNKDLFTAPAYGGKQLTAELLKAHNILFPPTNSEDYKNFRMYSYLRLIDACQLNMYVLDDDHRITYNLNNIQTYFKLFRTSNVLKIHNGYDLSIRGNLELDSTKGIVSDTFLIEQVGTSAAVTVLSTVKGKYLIGTKEFTNRSDASIAVANTTNNSSNEIQIGNHPLYFTILGDTSTTPFSATSKRWTFSATTPYTIKLADVYRAFTLNPALTKTLLTYAPDDYIKNIADESKSNLYVLSAIIITIENGIRLWQT